MVVGGRDGGGADVVCNGLGVGRGGSMVDVVVVVYSVAISGVEEVPARSQHDTKICDEISEVRRTQIPSLVPSGRVVPFGLFNAKDLQSVIRPCFGLA